MRAKSSIRYAVIAALCFSAAASAAGQKAAPNTTKTDKEEKNAATAKPEKDQFWFIGTSNYHLLLHESEAQIDRQLDTPFGILFPTWKRPTTFKDWSNDFILWDLWGGYGLDLSPKFSWAIYGGGGAGTVPNRHHYYPLGLPLEMRMDFTRVSLMAGTSISWYPFGRPEKREGGLLKNIPAARPMFEANVGYSHQISVGDVKLSVPVLGRVARIKDEKAFDMAWTSPRVGLEVPLTEDTTFNMLGGYLFFSDHSSEYNGALLEFFIRHRF